MKSYRIPKEAQFDGLDFTDLHILGFTRGAAGVSDFTDADTSQTFTLSTPVVGDYLHYPLAQAYTKTTFTGTSLSAVALDVGFSGGSEFLAAGAMLTANAGIGPVAAALPKRFDGSITYSAKVDTTGANLSAITAGEIWIFSKFIRLADALTRPYLGA